MQPGLRLALATQGVREGARVRARCECVLHASRENSPAHDCHPLFPQSKQWGAHCTTAHAHYI